MRVVIQRVAQASVHIDGNLKCRIGRGMLILIGIESSDDEQDALYLTQKISGLRIFADGEGKMNWNLEQVNGECLVVSQFTLHASTKKGSRPSFIRAARPEVAIPNYEMFLSHLSKALNREIQVGTFGADMQIQLVNDGPVTILIDSKNRE
jgi:D-aminoacyl-tRNA deacylase